MKRLQKLYDEEINFELSCFWDGGYRVRLGDESNGFVDVEDNIYDLDKAIDRLVCMAEKHYPKSGNPTPVAADRCTIPACHAGFVPDGTVARKPCPECNNR